MATEESNLNSEPMGIQIKSDFCEVNMLVYQSEIYYTSPLPLLHQYFDSKT